MINQPQIEWANAYDRSYRAEIQKTTPPGALLAQCSKQPPGRIVGIHLDG